MNGIELLHGLDEIIEKELADVVKKGKVEANEWENLKRLVCIMKEVKEVEQMLMEDDYDEGYSSRSYNTPFMPRMTYDSRGENMSHMRGRSKTTGRYMSRDGGYGRSNHSTKDRMIATMEGMYDKANSEHEKHLIDEMIKTIEDKELY